MLIPKRTRPAPTTSEPEKNVFPTQCYRRINCKQHAVRAVRYNSDGQYCLTAGGDKTIKLWNPLSGRLLSTYTGHGAEVADVRSSGDNSQLASGGNDCTVCLWDVSTGNTLRRWRKHPGRVNVVMFAGPTLESFGPNQFGGASLLLSGGVDGMLLAWDVKGKGPYPVQKMHEAKDSITSIAVNGHQIITGSVDRRVRTYDLRKGLMLEDYVGYPVTSVSISLDEQCLLVGCQDSFIRLFDATNGELLNKYGGHVNKSFHIDSGFCRKDSYIFSGCERSLTKRVFFWDLLSSKTEPLAIINHGANSPCWGEKIGDKLPPQAVYLTSTHFIHTVCPHPKKNKILTGGGDFIWEWGEPDELNSF